MRGKDYAQYSFCWKDWLEFFLQMLLKGFVICYLFYDSYQAGLILIPFAILDYKALKKRKLEKQKRELTLQFKSMMESLVTSLNAGYSLEKAFEETERDLHLIYDKQAFIFQELQTILSGIKMNVPLEQLLKEFGQRSSVDDIANFANVVLVAKRNGGNLIHVIQKTVQSITDKIAVEEDIETMITAKKFEQKIMMMMPYGIIFYMRMSNGGFFDVLYHNLLGIVLMTAFLIVIYIADFWAQKIMEIYV